MMTFTWIFLGALAIGTSIGFYLDARQRASVKSNRHAVPARFAENITLASHQKAADYTLAKMQVGTIASLYALVLILFWLVIVLVT